MQKYQPSMIELKSILDEIDKYIRSDTEPPPLTNHHMPNSNSENFDFHRSQSTKSSCMIANSAGSSDSHPLPNRTKSLVHKPYGQLLVGEHRERKRNGVS